MKCRLKKPTIITNKTFSKVSTYSVKAVCSKCFNLKEKVEPLYKGKRVSWDYGTIGKQFLFCDNWTRNSKNRVGHKVKELNNFQTFTPTLITQSVVNNYCKQLKNGHICIVRFCTCSRVWIRLNGGNSSHKNFKVYK